MTEIFSTYKNVARPAVQKQFGFKNAMQVPCISRVIISMRFNKKNPNFAKIAAFGTRGICLISGRKKIKFIVAKKSEAAFSVRKGDTIGAMVTLRKQEAFNALMKLRAIYMPIASKRHIPAKSFTSGSVSIGFDSISSFPEIDSITATAGQIGMTFMVCFEGFGKRQTDVEANKSLMLNMGFPIK